MENERIESFIRSFDREENSKLRSFRKEAESRNIPILRPATESLLHFLLKVKKPKEILEIGTAVGYSAISMALSDPQIHITTMESYEKRIEEARVHFQEFSVEDRITFLTGDAGEMLPKLNTTFDLIFLDAAKGQYITWLPDIVRLMKPGAVLLSDDIFQEGDVLESRFLVERRDRTIHERMREFLLALKENSDLDTYILPMDDGLTVSIRKDKK